MGYYGYHAVNKQRIRAGELVRYSYTDHYKGIGRALVLEFSTCSPGRPAVRPVREYRWPEYEPILKEWREGHAESSVDACPA